jgi:L-malate glycosyltransferase
VEIHQVVAGASYGDAITNEAIALRILFRQFGPSDIFSFHVPDPRVPDIHSLSQYGDRRSARSGNNVLLFHTAIGEPGVFNFLMRRTEPLVLRYHNITPPELFERFDPELANLLRTGREELVLLRPRVRLALADSRFNGQDLQAMGYDNVVVAPLVVDARALTAEPEASSLPLPTRIEGPVVTFVGRVAPNKGHPLLLQTFHILKTYLRPNAHLLLVGSLHHPIYHVILNRFIRELALPDVHFTGQVSNSQLAGIYRRTDVFLCLSEHEGFGVPLLEAMAFHVPIVASASTAVTETVGDGGLLLDAPGPAVTAEAVERVLTDERLRKCLQEQGTARLANFDPEQTSRLLVDAFKSLGS